jgi:hypothetical protein
MPLSYGSLTGAPVQDYELADGAATINVKYTPLTIAANSTGTQASGTLIPASASSANVAVTSAGVAYSVTLPPAVAGMEIDILTITATNTVAVFPSSGNTINALGANAGITMAALSSATFMCVTAGAWFTSPRVPS